MTAYATIKYVPQCECPLNGVLSGIAWGVPGIMCGTCGIHYKPEIVYHNVVAKLEGE